MADDVTCEKLRENGAELALGVLPGRERAEAVAHLERCADCREYVEQLTLAGDRLIGLLPDREPPPGFETRVARGLAQAVAEQHPHRRPVPPAHRDFTARVRRARLRLASVVAAFAIGCGAAGWAIGTAVEQITASAPPAMESEPMLVGDLKAPGGGPRPVGEIYARPGTPGWMFISVALAGPRAGYTGKVTCLLDGPNGRTVRIGDFTVRDGRGSWGATARIDPSAITGARVTTTDGTVLATTELRTGHVLTPEQT